MPVAQQSIFTPGTCQNVAYTGTAGTIANATGSTTEAVRVFVTTDAFIKISAAGTAATTADMFLPAYTVEYFCVPNGGVKVSAIQLAAGGTLYVTEVG